MNLKHLNRDGSMGIGLMIVFVALILAASISTAVIMKQAEDVSEKGESVSSGITDSINKRMELVGAWVAGGIDCSAELFQHAGFGGWSVVFDVGDYDRAAMEALGATDNDASSIKVEEGCNIVMYEGESFDGTWEAHFGAGDHALGSIEAAGGANDQISSISVMSFSLVLFLELGPGSPPILVDDVSTSTVCGNGDTVSIDYSLIVDSGARLIENTNTLGADANIALGETITDEMTVRVEMAFDQCVPNIGFRLPLDINVNYGAITSYILPIGSDEIGYDLMHQPW
ncbi:MAG: hypothetical protein ACJZ46_02895 [Candidatus Thalassarchaeaceae archaeon]